MEEVKCPICEHKAIITKTYDFQRAKWYHCELCGYFALTSFKFKLFNFKTYNKRNNLIFALRKLSSEDNYIEINSIKELDEIVTKVIFPNTIQDKIDLIIKFLYTNKPQVARGFALSEENSLMFGISELGELDLVINLSESKDYLRFHRKFAEGGGLCFLESGGIIRAENLLNNFKKDNDMNYEKKRQFNKCFLVHGRDNSKKLEVARFIETELDKKVIILHEQASRSKTIIEKIELHSDVDFAVCLYTADDLGSIKEEKPRFLPRARQNVVFEAGYFIGKLGRENVIILIDNEIEKPSDNDGIIYISFNGQWKDDIRKEVNAIYSDQ